MPQISIQTATGETAQYHCPAGTNLYDFLAEHHLLDAPCGGAGTCGKCKIRMTASTFIVLPQERAFFTEEELAAGWRLACLHQVQEDAALLLPPPESVSEISCKGFLRSFTAQPRIQKKLTPKGDTEVWADGQLLQTETGDTTASLYGIAVDIGTTTVVASLVDLNTGEESVSMSCLNGQKAFGQDVISRIQYAAAHENGTLILQRAILKDLCRLFEGIYAKAGVSAADIYEVTVGANTTMIHLLAGINPTAMGRAPYLPAFQGALQLRGQEDLQLPAQSCCQVYCIPAVSAFVGGDITAGVLACGIHQLKENCLFLDIGTNGEMVLAKDGRLCACSCAAGPALEGMNISCGVRAAKGAIEDVQLLEAAGEVKVRLSVIGDAPPKGLCGSGLLAAIAELRRVGILQKSGRLQDHPLVETVDGKKRFVLDAEHGIYLTQQDIRQVQLAKGAILSGIQAMLAAHEMAASEIDRVLVAGQFGAHLKAESLTGAGLIPAALEDVITYVGNTSKSGAYLCLLAEPERETAAEIVEEIHYIELSSLDGYDTLFVKAMNFA